MDCRLRPWLVLSRPSQSVENRRENDVKGAIKDKEGERALACHSEQIVIDIVLPLDVLPRSFADSCSDLPCV